MTTGRRQWDERHHELARNLRVAGFGYRRTAAIVGCHPAQIAEWLALPMVDSPHDVDGAVSMYIDGASVRSVADTHGVDRRTVLRWLRRSGIPTRERGRPRQLAVPPAAELAARYQAATAAELAAHYGVSVQTVLRWLRGAGIAVRPRGARPNAPQPRPAGEVTPDGRG